MGKKGSKTPYINYYMSMHLGYCHGPVDGILALIVKDKNALDDGEFYAAEADIEIDKNDMFGGNLKEGGLLGNCHFLPGKEDQVAPASLASRVGLTPETMPGFRHLASLWFYGGKLSDRPGFKFASNAPALPSIWARLARSSRTLVNNVGSIIGQSTDCADTNPANIIHECLVNEAWGMGGPVAQIDEPSFQYAAQVLFNEHLGLSMLWTRQQSIEAFIQDILDHINGVFFLNPYNGKATLRLLRADYDPETIPQVGPDVAELTNFRRPLWKETVNEIIISWTHPFTEETETVTYQDLGNIAMQGEVVSETRNYYGVRNGEVAAALGSREIRTASTPLATARLRIDRTYAPFLPGDCLRLNWPPYDIQNMVMRVMNIEWGTPADSKITLELTEDIFGLPYAVYGPPPETEWEPPEKDPNDELFDEIQVVFRSIPYSLIRGEIGDLDIDISDDRFPQIIIGIYALPTPEQTDWWRFEAYGPGITTTGTPEWESVGVKNTTGHSRIIGALAQEVMSEIEIEDVVGGDRPEVGAIGVIILGQGEGGDSDARSHIEFVEEWFLFEEDLGDGKWMIRRGILDTVPKAWTANQQIVIMTESWDAYDTSTRLADINEQYMIQVMTTDGSRDMTTISPITTKRPDRPYRPYRPANVHVEATMFGTSDQSQNPNNTSTIFDDLHEPRQWNIHCTWSRRNRNMEDQVYFRWDAPDVPPEDGQTTEIVILTLAGEEVGRIVGITGTSYDLPLFETTARMENLKLRFMSRRNGLESLQGIEIGLKLYLKGYGSDWGYAYGGWPEDPLSPPVTLP